MEWIVLQISQLLITVYPVYAMFNWQTTKQCRTLKGSSPFNLVLCFLIIFDMTSCATASTDYNAEKLLEILVERVLPEGLNSLAVYVSKQPLASGSTISSWQSDYVIPKKYNQAWFYFVDDVPEANWEHPCRYIFIDIETGNYQIILEKTPPKIFTELNKFFPKN